MEREKTVDVTGKYGQELRDISFILNNIRDGRFYDNTNAKMDGSLVTNIDNLKKKLKELIYKIEFNKDSTEEVIQNALKDINI